MPRAITVIEDVRTVFDSLVPRPHPLREKGLVNLGRILGPPLRNFHAPIRLPNS